MKAYANERSGERAGFTLVELLVVMIIIAILAALTLSIQRISVETARRSRTRTTISKIDSILTSLYEKYQYRKVDVEQYSDADLEAWTNIDVTDDASRRRARLCLRTLMLRELARMEMPTCIAEAGHYHWVSGNFMLCEDSFDCTRTDKVYSYYGQESALNSSYQAVLRAEMTNAELLYLIVTNGDPESRTAFHGREIADTNGNGLMEFVDGWEQPIRFLRWAPSLLNTSRQPVLPETWIEDFKYSGQQNMSNPAYTEYLAQYPTDVLERYPDPLNPLGSSLSDPAEACSTTDPYCPYYSHLGTDEQQRTPWPDGWLLVPLVFSFGPDGEPGMANPTKLCNNPFKAEEDLARNGGAETEESLLLGKTVLGEDGTDYTLDNITNHNFYNQ